MGVMSHSVGHQQEINVPGAFDYKHICPRYVQDMSKKKQNNVEINIYGGNIQVMPNVRELEQHVHTKDGETVIINKFKS